MSMTEQEAADYLRAILESSTLPRYQEALRLAVEALERAAELAHAERDGRLVVLPCKEGDELKKGGLTFVADHWNVLLTAFRDDGAPHSIKQVKLFSTEEAEAALKKRGAGDETN